MSTTNEISGLKAGDKVAVNGGYNREYTIHTISKITPSGQIVLENGTRFKDGVEIGSSSRWHKDYVYAVTPAILDSINRRKVRADIDRILDTRILDQMSTKELERVLAVLKKHEAD